MLTDRIFEILRPKSGEVGIFQPDVSSPLTCKQATRRRMIKRESNMKSRRLKPSPRGHLQSGSPPRSRRASIAEELMEVRARCSAFIERETELFAPAMCRGAELEERKGEFVGPLHRRSPKAEERAKIIHLTVSPECWTTLRAINDTFRAICRSISRS